MVLANKKQIYLFFYGGVLILKITMFGFKSNVFYQLDKRQERLYERYFLRATKQKLEAKKKELKEINPQTKGKINIKA